MRRTRGLELRVGILLASAATLLVAFVLALGSFSFASGYTLYVDFDYSGNIRPGAPVKVSGVKVGKVDDVVFWGGRFDEAVGRRVQVRLVVWIEDKARDTIRRDAELYINTAGVLGEQYLEIVPGDDYDHPPVAPESVLVGHSPPRTDLLLSRLYEVLDSVSSVLRDDRELIRKLLANSASAVGELNTFLVDNRAQLGELITHTSALAGQATTTLDKVNEGLGDPRVIARTIRGADALLVRADQAIATLTPPVETFVRDAHRVTSTITDERVERALGAADRVASAADTAGGAIAKVDSLVSEVQAGKGTVGALLVREEIYADLREMIRDLKRNPWKFFWKE